MKPIYNHETGLKDPDEPIDPNHIMVLEGLWLLKLYDFGIYIDIADEVKYEWKISRDMKERGWTEHQVIDSIERRRPDFAAYVDPQKKDADVIIQVLPSEMKELESDDKYKVRLIQMSDNPNYRNVELTKDIPQFSFGTKADLYCLENEFKVDGYDFVMRQYREQVGEKEAHVIEMDGVFRSSDEIKIVESWLKNAGTNFRGELAQQISRIARTEEAKKSVSGLGALNGTGLMQSIVAFKIKELYEATRK